MCWSRDLSLLQPRNSTGYQSTIATKVVVHRNALLRECRQSSRPSTKYGARIILEPVCEVRPRKDHSGVNLISDALPFGRLWYGEPNAISNAKHRSCSHDAVRGGRNFFCFGPSIWEPRRRRATIRSQHDAQARSEVLERDPYYNPNLSREHADFSLSK